MLLLTEDGGRHAHEVLEHLTRHLLGRAWPERSRDLQLQLLPPDPKARARMGANRWKERGQDQVNFIQTLATDLSKPDVFVLVHFDGDRPWSVQPGAIATATRALFERQILGKVRQLLEGRGLTNPLEKLLIVEPFYSIEAWLYQNTDELRRWYAEHHARGHADLDAIATWDQDPQALDELEQPKERLVVRDRHNLHLAQRGFPAAKAERVGKSFAATVRALAACAPLRRLVAGEALPRS